MFSQSTELRLFPAPAHQARGVREAPNDQDLRTSKQGISSAARLLVSLFCYRDPQDGSETDASTISPLPAICSPSPLASQTRGLPSPDSPASARTPSCSRLVRRRNLSTFRGSSRWFLLASLLPHLHAQMAFYLTASLPLSTSSTGPST